MGRQPSRREGPKAGPWCPGREAIGDGGHRVHGPVYLVQGVVEVELSRQLAGGDSPNA